jgi:HSP20 family molecular chaperone IbpA
MRTFDFAPLYRSTVGFDRMFSVLDQLDGLEGSVPSYPPYNIERNGDNAFRISVAVAGFTNGRSFDRNKGKHADGDKMLDVESTKLAA